MRAWTVVLATALALAGVGCGDPLGDSLEADRPSLEGPPLEAGHDGELVRSETTVALDPTVPPADPAATSTSLTTVPATTTTTDPGAAAKEAWVAQVMAICAEEYDGLATAEVPEDPEALRAQVEAVVSAYTTWADRVEALPLPDRRTEANLVEGLRRLRRSVDLLGPAAGLAASGDVAGARQAWWSWAHAISGASTALAAAGVPDACFT